MTIKNITVRPYVPSDFPDVKQNLTEGEMFYEEIYSKKRMQEKSKRDPESILVAEVDGKVVGQIYIVTDWGPLLFGLSVRKSHRNLGIGKKLIVAALKILKAKGFADVNLLVREDRKVLHELYTRWGFEKSHNYRWMWKKLK